MRKHIPLKVKLAAALLSLREYGSDGQWLPVIDHWHAKQMSANQIISLFQWDHYPVPHADGGPDEPWNLMPELIRSHREKTRKVDVPQIAKNKRIQRKEQDHRDKLGTVQTRWITRADVLKMYPREAAKAGIKSRGFDKTKTKGFDGKVRKRAKAPR